MSIEADFANMKEAVHEMQTLNGQIQSQMDTMQSECSSAAKSLSGQHADAYRVFQQKVGQLEAQMSEAFTSGQNALDEMIRIHQTSDAQGASILGH